MPDACGEVEVIGSTSYGADFGMRSTENPMLFAFPFIERVPSCSFE